jgi:hypothetical protein
MTTNQTQPIDSNSGLAKKVIISTICSYLFCLILFPDSGHTLSCQQKTLLYSFIQIKQLIRYISLFLNRPLQSEIKKEEFPQAIENLLLQEKQARNVSEVKQKLKVIHVLFCEFFCFY